MAKIAFFEAENWEKKYLKERLKKHDLYFTSSPLNPKTASRAEDAQVVSTFIYSKVDGKVLGKLKRCKIITTRSTGFDHIDLDECKKREVRVSNVPEYGSETVAEHAMALVLALAKKLIPSVFHTRRGNLQLAGLKTFDLENKVLGIVGFGKIGKNVARMANSFNMKVVAFDPFAKREEMGKKNTKKVSLDWLLKNSDIISLHCPLNEHTRYIIDKDAIKKMKKGVFLVNTARGSLVNTKDLIDGLDSGKIEGAGIDVLEYEDAIKEERQLLSPSFRKKADLQTVIATQMLLLKRNVIVTPHNAFNSKEALQRILETTVKNIKGYLGRRSRNLVKKRRK